MPKYNHAFDFAFEVVNDKENDATDAEILAGLEKRVAYFRRNPEQIREACGLFDTFEVEIDK